MRTFKPEFQARLTSGATKMCHAWRVDRKDGVVLGFTDHDCNIYFDDVTFFASSGLDAGTLQTSNGLSVDNGLAVGALRSDSISEEDIRFGKYDGAAVCQWLVDWEYPELREILFRGSFGEIRRADGRFEVELRGLAEALNRPIGRTIGRTCDRTLGDGKCGFKNLYGARFSKEGKVDVGSTGATIVVSDASEFGNSYEKNWFTEGRIEWLSGRNRGEIGVVKSEIKFNGRRAFVLWETPPAPLELGDQFRITAGCDKSFDTCRDKFDNLLNFRGFPHIPGDDWVMAYPKDGTINDGGSKQSV